MIFFGLCENKHVKIVKKKLTGGRWWAKGICLSTPELVLFYHFNSHVRLSLITNRNEINEIESEAQTEKASSEILLEYIFDDA